MKNKKISLELLAKDFEELRDNISGQAKIKTVLRELEDNDPEYLGKWYKLSKDYKHVYPSQGLLTTPFDFLEYKSKQLLPSEKLFQTLRLRRFFLELFNHPYRIHYLNEIENSKFVAPPKIDSKLIDNTQRKGLSLSIGDIGATVIGSGNERIRRTERYAQGPFVKLGKHARTIFVGSEQPDVWNSAPALSTMASSHCIACAPRNGIMTEIKRQCDLVKESVTWLNNLADEMLWSRDDRKEVLKFWRNNIFGAVEADPEKAVVRGEALVKAGVKGLRVYSPEPGTGTVKTVLRLKKEFGNDIEIFAGQVVDTFQARELEDAGADALYIGIGGGGRCITGVRSGSAIDWPDLLWNLRGTISIPVIVQGGASEHIAITLLLGATGIGVSRVVSGGTIESPGGALYCLDSSNTLFKPYGGEASARTKYLEKKLLPFDIPSFVEGETTKAKMSYVKYTEPTLTYNLHTLIEDSILALVFRGAKSVEELHSINPSPLRRITNIGAFQQDVH